MSLVAASQRASFQTTRWVFTQDPTVPVTWNNVYNYDGITCTKVARIFLLIIPALICDLARMAFAVCFGRRYVQPLPQRSSRSSAEENLSVLTPGAAAALQKENTALLLNRLQNFKDLAALVISFLPHIDRLFLMDERLENLVHLERMAVPNGFGSRDMRLVPVLQRKRIRFAHPHEKESAEFSCGFSVRSLDAHFPQISSRDRQLTKFQPVLSPKILQAKVRKVLMALMNEMLKKEEAVSNRELPLLIAARNAEEFLMDRSTELDPLSESTPATISRFATQRLIRENTEFLLDQVQRCQFLAALVFFLYSTKLRSARWIF